MIRHLFAGATLLAALALPATASQAQSGHGHRGGHGAHAASDHGHHRAVPHTRGHRGGPRVSLHSGRHGANAGIFVGRRHGFSLRPSLHHRGNRAIRIRRHAEDRAHEAFEAYRHYGHRQGLIARRRAHEAREDYEHYRHRAEAAREAYEHERHRAHRRFRYGLFGVFGHSRHDD